MLFGFIDVKDSFLVDLCDYVVIYLVLGIE